MSSFSDDSKQRLIAPKETQFRFSGAFTVSIGLMLKSVNQSLADLLINSYFSTYGIEYKMAKYRFMAATSVTEHIYLTRNSFLLPTTPKVTRKQPTIIPPSFTLKNSEHQSKSSPSTIITLPVGAAQQRFASLSQTQDSTLILDTTNNASLVQFATTALVTTVMSNINTSQQKTVLTINTINRRRSRTQTTFVFFLI